ncbi:hypothetical protein, partial [Vibrio penaeicida]|uniref:hypothetical protein n=1 Tax=Vibrio penaeicida TaxID=104609 RepID=UPI001F1FEBEA
MKLPKQVFFGVLTRPWWTITLFLIALVSIGSEIYSSYLVRSLFNGDNSLITFSYIVSLYFISWLFNILFFFIDIKVRKKLIYDVSKYNME